MLGLRPARCLASAITGIYKFTPAYICPNLFCVPFCIVNMRLELTILLLKLIMKNCHTILNLVDCGYLEPKIFHLVLIKLRYAASNATVL